MPPVDEDELGELVISGKIGAISLDTTAFDRYQCNLKVRALLGLSQFRGTPTRFLLSEIVVNEVKSHITTLATQSHVELRAALNKVRKGWRCEPDIASVDALLGLTMQPTAFAQALFDEFANETAPEIVKVEGLVSHDEVIRRYFAAEPPFSKTKAKKSEFPDALALLSLEAWAAANKTIVLLISNDGDWRKFAEQSDYIVVVSELGTALDHFNVSNNVRKTVAHALEMLRKADAADMQDEIERTIELFLEQFDPEVEAYASLEYEIDNIEPSLQDWSVNAEASPKILYASPEIIVFTVSIIAIVSFEGTFAYSLHDGVDREYASLGSDRHETEETIMIPMTISMQSEIGDEPIIERIEITPFRVVIHFGSIDPNWDYEE